MPSRPGASFLLLLFFLAAVCGWSKFLDRSIASARPIAANDRITQGQLRILDAQGKPGAPCPLMDILLPDASARLPFLQRNAGGRLFHKADDLNRFITSLNAAGGVNGAPLPLVGADARFNDGFQSVDLRLTKRFRLRGGDAGFVLGGEFFNLLNVTNILGWSNYSGFANALARDSGDAGNPGFLKTSSFGRPLTTAGRLFTAGGPRSFQFVAKFSF